MSDIAVAAINQAGKIFDRVANDSKSWTRPQKIGGFLVCLLVGIALISGISYMRGLGGAAVILFGVILLDPVNANILRRTVETEMIVLRNRKGVAKIVLHADDGIMLFDESMNTLVAAKIYEGQAALIAKSGDESVVSEAAQGKAIVSVGQATERGIGTGSRITATTVTVGPADGSGVLLTANGKEQIIALSQPGELKNAGLYMATRPDSSTLVVGKSDRAQLWMNAQDDGNLNISLMNANGGIAAGLAWVPDSLSASLTVYDDRGASIAEYPDVETLARHIAATKGAAAAGGTSGTAAT